MAVREGNWILGVYACDAGKPPVTVRYLVDPDVAGADLTHVDELYTVRPSLYVVDIVFCSSGADQSLRAWLCLFGGHEFRLLLGRSVHHVSYTRTTTCSCCNPETAISNLWSPGGICGRPQRVPSAGSGGRPPPVLLQLLLLYIQMGDKNLIVTN